PDPVGVVVARVELGQPALRVEGDVRAPHPDHVGGTDRGEDVVHMPPHGRVVTGLVAVDGGRPGVPDAVHLVREPDGDVVAEALDPLGVFADVVVEVAGGDPGQPVLR